MAASLRSTRPVAKAVLPNRVGRIGHRLSSTILMVRMSGGILFQRSGQISDRGDRARSNRTSTAGASGKQPHRAGSALWRAVAM